MKLTFIGAAHEVTGSCTLLDCCGGNFLIDYGMEQGVNVFENVPLPVLPGQIDVVFLTHAHIDHSGMPPRQINAPSHGRFQSSPPRCSRMRIQETQFACKNAWISLPA